MSCIKVRSSDGETFNVDVKIAKSWMMIKTMLDLDVPDKEDEVIPTLNVTSVVLEKVIQWSTYHKDDPAWRGEDEEITRLPQWDATFLEVDQCTLFGLINAANYLDIRLLLHFSCLKVANMFEGKTPEQIRKTFNMADDLTAEEKERIRDGL